MTSFEEPTTLYTTAHSLNGKIYIHTIDIPAVTKALFSFSYDTSNSIECSQASQQLLVTTFESEVIARTQRFGRKLA